ncbi:class I SAM-dependent DNA methyltransferase [Actibacterium ureilyticum]|uniref:class I SAM-dependent DNA methyltransferase n=1 Tax=Actibacterium ureilyticum TaxID=1590614 RepID=UPI000BAAEB86|nr:class I SAM-dependent methyltransferase [Actibacterium ureilyticum]
MAGTPPRTDSETIAVYTRSADAYAKGFAEITDVDQAADLSAFLGPIPDGGLVLDLGCGPGQWAAAIRDQGYVVEATDATTAMAELAAQRFGIDVRVEPFDALSAVARYDGVWANFSLLHAPRAAFPGHLARVHRALKPGGMFHIGMKLGTDEGRDHLGRFYAYYEEDELKTLLSQAGFTTTRTRRGHGKGLAGTDDTFAILTAHA